MNNVNTYPKNGTGYQGHADVIIDAFHVNQRAFLSLIEKSFDLIALLDVAGMILYASPSTERLLGYSNEEFVGRSGFEFFHPDDHENTNRLLADILEKPGSHEKAEFRLRHKDGFWLWMEGVSTNLLTDPQVRAIVVNCRDITASKQIQAVQSQLAAIVEFSDDAIISKTLDGTITSWNQAATKLFGYTAEEVVGKSITILFPPDRIEEEAVILKKLVSGESIHHYETLRLRKDKTPIHVSLSISPVKDRDGKVIGVSKIARDITERKRVEAALEESDRLRHSTVDVLSAHIAFLDETGTIIGVNQAWKNFAEANDISSLANNFEGMNYLTVCDQAIGKDAELATVFADGIRAVMQNKREDYSLEYPCHSPSEQRWFVGRVTRFPGDGPVRVVIAHENITERKQIENELTALYDATSFLFKSNSLVNLGYQVVQAVITTFEHVHCALYLKEKTSGQIVRFTRSGVYEASAEKSLSVEDHGLVPQAFRTGENIYSPNVLTDALYLASDARTRSELVIPLITASGTLAVLDLQSMNPDAFSPRDQRILTAFAERAAAAIETMQLYEDNQRHAAELEWRVSKRTAELQRAKDQVEAILNQSSDALMLVDSNTDIQQTNPAFSHLLGYTIEEAFGKNIRVLADAVGAQILVEAIEKVILMHEPHRIEVVLQRIDGSTFDADVALAPLTRYETNNVRVICSIRDNTEQKQEEAALRKSLLIEKELNELKTRFVAMVSHDFRTPLATIQSSSDLLRLYTDRMSDERKQEHFDTISGQIGHLAGLLEDVITISQADSVGLPFNPILTDLAVFCQKIVDEVQRLVGTRQIKLVVSWQMGLVEIDTKLLRRVIVNLLSNAAKYSPEGSVIEFSLSYGNKQAVIRIKDQGIGIPEADQVQLFEVFHRAMNVGSIPGTGLGLAIVKRAVEAHGGSIAVESRVDLGTTFTISLPVNPMQDAIA